MSHINFTTLSGVNIFEKLTLYVQQQADLTKPRGLTVPLVVQTETQRGENCKLVALANAIEHAALITNTQRVPLYKNKSSPVSLRQFAKTYGSMVGEMYSLESLKSTCQAAGFMSKAYAPKSEESYILTIIQLIDDNLAPIIFFDLDNTRGERYGLPRMGDGKNEHAGVVGGYYTNALNETHFIILYWGQYYDIIARELALSSIHSLADRREVETFCKVLDPQGITKWVLFDRRHKFGAVMEGVPLRTASPMKPTDTALKGKILVVTNPIVPSPFPFFSQLPDIKSQATGFQSEAPVHAFKA
jgi:hypothetical protein